MMMMLWRMRVLKMLARNVHLRSFHSSPFCMQIGFEIVQFPFASNTERQNARFKLEIVGRS